MTENQHGILVQFSSVTSWWHCDHWQGWLRTCELHFRVYVCAVLCLASHDNPNDKEKCKNV